MRIAIVEQRPFRPQAERDSQPATERLDQPAF